jgi:hypothetical protein
MISRPEIDPIATAYLGIGKTKPGNGPVLRDMI